MTGRRGVVALKRIFRLGEPAQRLTDGEAQSEIESVLRLLLKPNGRHCESARRSGGLESARQL